MSRAKGNRTRRKAITYLKENGYIVDVVEKTGRWVSHKDLFAGYCIYCWTRGDEECCSNFTPFSGFDLIALKGKHTTYVQVKTNTPAAQKEYKTFAKNFASRNVKVWVMTWYDRKGWRIQKYYSNGTINELDLRK